MSDENETAAEIIGHLEDLYETFIGACRNLPVPITLPEMRHLADGTAALAYTARIAEDQPMPDLQRVQLEHACLHWLSATELVGQYMLTPTAYRARAAEINAEACDISIIALIMWQAENL